MILSFKHKVNESIKINIYKVGLSVRQMKEDEYLESHREMRSETNMGSKWKEHRHSNSECLGSQGKSRS